MLQSHFDGFAVNLVHGFTDRVELCLSQQSVGFVASDKSGVRTVGDGVVQSRTQRFVFLLCKVGKRKSKVGNQRYQQEEFEYGLHPSNLSVFKTVP